MPTKLLKLADVAKILDVSEARAYAMAREGIIPVVRMGKQIRVDPEALRTWIQNGGQSYEGGWRREPKQQRTAVQ